MGKSWGDAFSSQVRRCLGDASEDCWRSSRTMSRLAGRLCLAGLTNVWERSEVFCSRMPKEDWIPSGRSGPHLRGRIIWPGKVQWPWGHGSRHVKEDLVFLQWSCGQWHVGRNYVQRAEDSHTRVGNDGSLGRCQVMAQLPEVTEGGLVYWQWVSQGFFPQDMVGQRQQRWHDQCHFWSGGGIWHSFVDRESSESEQSLRRFVKRSGVSFWRSRKSQGEPAGNLEVAGQVIQLWWSPQSPEGGRKRGCGDEYHRKFPTFKKKRECACLQGFTVHGLLHTSYMAASVGPKAQ